MLSSDYLIVPQILQACPIQWILIPQISILDLEECLKNHQKSLFLHTEQNGLVSSAIPKYSNRILSITWRFNRSKYVWGNVFWYPNQSLTVGLEESLKNHRKSLFSYLKGKSGETAVKKDFDPSPPISHVTSKRKTIFWLSNCVSNPSDMFEVMYFDTQINILGFEESLKNHRKLLFFHIWEVNVVKLL